MNRISVSSSNISSVGYERGTLEIAFVSGAVYQYFNVPERIYQGLMSAPSKGRYFHTHIKQFETKKIGFDTNSERHYALFNGTVKKR